MSYWYLATPYKLYPEGKEAAYQAALTETAYLLSRGIPVYSPIVHNHPVSALLPERDGDFSFWVETVDRPLMEGAGGILVCMLPSWEISAGIVYELDLFGRHGKPRIFYPPGNIPSLPSLDRQLGVVLAEELGWQNATFPSSTSQSRACHLLREAKELADHPEDAGEMADVLLLLSHLANGANGPNVSLVQAVINKQAINKSRQWGSPDAQGVVEHVKEER